MEKNNIEQWKRYTRMALAVAFVALLIALYSISVSGAKAQVINGSDPLYSKHIKDGWIEGRFPDTASNGMGIKVFPKGYESDYVRFIWNNLVWSDAAGTQQVYLSGIQSNPVNVNGDSVWYNAYLVSGKNIKATYINSPSQLKYELELKNLSAPANTSWRVKEYLTIDDVPASAIIELDDGSAWDKTNNKQSNLFIIKFIDGQKLIIPQPYVYDASNPSNKAYGYYIMSKAGGKLRGSMISPPYSAWSSYANPIFEPTISGGAVGTVTRTCNNMNNGSYCNLTAAVNATNISVNINGIPSLGTGTIQNGNGYYFTIPILNGILVNGDFQYNLNLSSSNFTYGGNLLSLNNFSDVRVRHNGTSAYYPQYIISSVDGSYISLFFNTTDNLTGSDTVRVDFGNQSTMTANDENNTFPYANFNCNLGKVSITGAVSCDTDGIKVEGGNNWNTGGAVGTVRLNKPFELNWKDKFSASTVNSFGGITETTISLNIVLGILKDDGGAGGTTRVCRRLNTSNSADLGGWSPNIIYANKLTINSAGNYNLFINGASLATGTFTANGWLWIGQVYQASQYAWYDDIYAIRHADTTPTIDYTNKSQIFAYPYSVSVTEKGNTTTNIGSGSFYFPNFVNPVQDFMISNNLSLNHMNVTLSVQYSGDTTSSSETAVNGNYTQIINYTPSNYATNLTLTFPINDATFTGATYKGTLSYVTNLSANVTGSGYNTTALWLNISAMAANYPFVASLSISYNNAPTGSITNTSCEYSTACNIAYTASDAEGNTLNRSIRINGIQNYGNSPIAFNGLAVGNYSSVLWLNETDATVSPQNVNYTGWVNITLDVTPPTTPVISNGTVGTTTIPLSSTNSTDYSWYLWEIAVNTTGIYSYIGNTTANTTTATGLTAGQTYDIRLRVNDSSGNPSSYSNVITVQTSATDPSYQLILSNQNSIMNDLADIKAKQIEQDESILNAGATGFIGSILGACLVIGIFRRRG